VVVVFKARSKPMGRRYDDDKQAVDPTALTVLGGQHRVVHRPVLEGVPGPVVGRLVRGGRHGQVVLVGHPALAPRVRAPGGVGGGG
jgi:hypothetical protein